jgi:hypothetical protein
VIGELFSHYNNKKAKTTTHYNNKKAKTTTHYNNKKAKTTTENASAMVLDHLRARKGEASPQAI